MARILLMNIPAGPFPSDYPPVAISRVMEGIDPSLGCDTAFLNLDLYRLSFEQITARIRDFSPEIIGISAMLTPSYSYVKKLSNFIGERFPDAVQVLGGQMNVIANIILLRTKVKFCVIGESEPAFSSLISLLKEDGFRPVEMEKYAQIKGLVFLKNSAPFFTGYAEESKEAGVRQFNYKLISRFSGLENYIHRIDGQYFKVRLPNSRMDDLMRLFRSENTGKNLATAFTSKGCVNRCTFCHRFTKGYQVIDNQDVISYIEALKKDRNVGMILFSEENFGNHRKATARLVEYLKTSGLNWAAPAVRVKSINEEIIRSWKDAGCVHVNFGIESLSQKILDVMEKNSTVEENMEAIRLCYRHGIFTVLGLVIGMPGETEETIDETIRNLSAVIPDDISVPFEVYINFVQAIPGTPVYEYARKVGLIGNSIDEEERYIEGLYDIDANEIRHYLNFTDYEKEELAYWKYYISMELITAYVRKNGFFNVLKRKRTRPYRIGLVYSLTPKMIRKPALKYSLAIRTFGIGSPFRIFYKKLKRRLSRESGRFSFINRSLRKINRELPELQRNDDMSTAVLRESR